MWKPCFTVVSCIVVVAGQPEGARLATYDFMNLQDTTKYVEGTHIDDDDSPALPEISSHNFIFVAGPHHSGTTLMSLLVGQNTQVARLINTSVPQGEGQHLQDVYPKAYNVGGMLRYAFSREAHLTEQSDLCTNTSAIRLFRAWSKHWDLTKPNLVEKTPNHMVMTRFLQRLFTPKRTKFVITIRHPLGCSHFKWKLVKQLKNFQSDCGYQYVKHWLAQMEILEHDIKYLKNVQVVMFEYFTANGYGPTNYKRLMNAIDLPAELNISTSLRKERYPLTKMIEIDEQRKKMKKLREEEPWRFKEKKPRRQLVWTDDEEGGEWEEGVQLEDVNERGSTMQNGMGAAFEEDGMRRNDVAEERGRRRHRHGRKLQGYIGKAVGAETMDLELHTERWMSWTEAWDERIPKRVNSFGYSLKHPEVVKIPKSFQSNVLIPQEADLHTSEFSKFKKSLGIKLQDASD
eukprot:gene3987-33281_t